MKSFNKNILEKTTFSLVFVTILSATFLTRTPPFAHAEESSVSTATVTILESCSMTGIVNTPHDAVLQNGTYSGTDYPNGVGTTTLKAYCNDSAGFAIYAIGYTNNEYGNTTLHSDALGSDYDINTGLYQQGSANSSWSMKLASVSGTYAPTVADGTNGTENFTTWHTVPTTYTKVAYRASGTDAENEGEGVGSSLTTTYDIYVSPTQISGTYIGQVKYTMVHPSTAAEPVPDDQVGIQYNGNGLTFAGGATTNRVNYGQTCGPMYIGPEPEIATSSNFYEENGAYEQDGAYADDEDTIVPITIEGATKLYVNISYGIDSGTDLMVVQGNWNSWDIVPTNYEEIVGQADGGNEFIFDGNTVTFMMKNFSDSAPAKGYDYGFYAEVYPLYTTEEEDSEEFEAEEQLCWLETKKGTYAETTTWNGKWFADDGAGGYIYFDNELAILSAIEQDYDSMKGNLLEVYAYYPYVISYNGNNATAGTMQGFTTTSNSATTDLLAPNFLRTGYGFAGWSENPNATVNSNFVIYGPSQSIDAQDLNLSNRSATLYAVWVQSSGNMQSWNGCNSLNNGQVIALTDTRDSSVYTVGKMADGNCWMMENLRLSVPNTTLTSSDTNIPTGTTFYMPTSSTSFLCLGVQESQYVSCTNTNRWDDSRTSSNTTPGESQWYSYGNYYNWYSATAGYGQYYTASTEWDICPSRWRLPGSFSPLSQYIGSTTSNSWRSYPYNYVYSGSRTGRMIIPDRVFGDSWAYWTSVGKNYTNRGAYAYSLTASGNSVNAASSSDKSYGLTIRCVNKYLIN